MAVYGESQSAMISSQVITELQQEGVDPDAVKFVLVGDVDNPDGGWGARFDTSFPAFTTTPLNIISDLNALLGIEFVHPTYRDLTTAELKDISVI